jgi:hypothetical protein
MVKAIVVASLLLISCCAEKPKHKKLSKTEQNKKFDSLSKQAINETLIDLKKNGYIK